MIELLVPGVHATVQDAGRFGHLRLGVPTSGPADRLAHALANALVGNPPGAAAIEVTGLPFAFVAHRSLLVAATGREVRLVGRDALPGWTCMLVRAGQEVRIEGPSRYAYVAFGGGVEAPLSLGSRAAYPIAGIGPAPLAAGQRVRVREARFDAHRGGLAVEPPAYERAGLRVLLGPHDGRIDVEPFLAASFRVDERSDRMGVRLQGPRIATREGELLTSGMVEGAVQIPTGGDPIVLLADHQTTGGYPVVATVIAADLGVLAQKHPGEAARFAVVDDALAVGELQRVRREIGRLAEPTD